MLSVGMVKTRERARTHHFAVNLREDRIVFGVPLEDFRFKNLFSNNKILPVLSGFGSYEEAWACMAKHVELVRLELRKIYIGGGG